MKYFSVSGAAKRPFYACLSKLLAIILALCILAGYQAIGFASASAEADGVYAPQGDYVWAVRGGKSNVYLMGSMHIVLPDYALSPNVIALINGCDAVALESDIEDEATIEAISAMYTYPEGDNLFAHLSDRGEAHFAWLCEQYGIKPWDLATLRPFAASSVFSELAADAMGFSFEGVDDLVLAEAKAAGKPILALEDGATIYERFTSLDDDTLERMCILASYGPVETAYSMLALYLTYIEGDVDALEAFLDGGGGSEPIGGDGLPIVFEKKDDLYDQYMQDDRNKAWIDVIEGWLETPDRDVFIVAGVSHFIGAGSVVELLEAEGYTVELVEFDQEQLAA